MSRRKWLTGERVPAFVLRSPATAKYHFDSTAGRYLVLFFLGSAALAESRAVLDHFIAHRALFDEQNAAFFGVSVDPADEAEARLVEATGMRYFWDFDKTVSTLFGAAPAEDAAGPQYHPFTLIIDPMLRVIAAIPLDNAEQHNSTFDAIFASLPPADLHAETEIHAPVLILPRVFERDFCRFLIDLFEKDGGSESGFMREVDGKTVGIYDSSFKRRRDFGFDHKPEFEPLRASIRARVMRKLVPEIQRVFSFQATRMERYIVSRYDSAGGGFFRPHRDNTTAGTAHRRFACTINLNAEHYAGGDLRFPEFGRKTYRAPTGGAVLFSCSLLHEATPVTSGTRYAFLPFFYNEEAAALRQKNAHAISGQVVDRNKGEDENRL